MDAGEKNNTYQWIGTKNLAGVRVLVCDIDQTLYTKHHPYHVAGTQEEAMEITRILNQRTGEAVSFNTMEARILARRRELSVKLARPASMTETVLSFGITFDEWNALRCRAWNPDRWLSLDVWVCGVLYELSQKHTLAFGTNSPTAVAKRVLALLGVSEILPNAPVFGPDTFGISKPNPDFFSRIAERLEIPAHQCFSIGDRMENDGAPAIAAGYAGALIVPGGRDAFIAACQQNFTGQKVEVRYGS